MGFWLIVYKQWKVKRALARLEAVKLNAYRASQGLPPKYPWYEALLRWILSSLQFLFLRACCWWCLRKRKGDDLSLWESLWTQGTFANSVLKSCIGLICGLLLTHLLTLTLTFTLNWSPSTVTSLSLLYGPILSFGLAFSSTLQLLALLTFPILFTRKGRGVMLAWALILATSGPAKNTARNMEIMTQSLVCGEEMIKEATKGLVDLITNPLSFFGETLKKVVGAVKGAAGKIQNGLKPLFAIIQSIVEAIKFAYAWLKRIVEVCNDKVGTPFDRCWRLFDEAISDCKVKLPSALQWTCYAVKGVQQICWPTKVVDLLCWLPSLVKDVIWTPIKKALSSFLENLKIFFDVRVKDLNYSFRHSFNSSKSFKEIAAGMTGEVMGQLQWLLQYIDLMDLFISLFLFTALYNAFIYRRRFLVSDRHDNYYITKGLVKLDLARKRLGRDGIFPLKLRESRQYVQTSSWALIESERKELKYSLALVTLAATQILLYVLIDFCFYLFLELLRRHGGVRVDTRDALGFNVKVEGDGFIADMFRAILEALSPVGALMPTFDTTPCLPVPSPPNYWIYSLIVALILFCYIATLSQPYVVRLRHLLCGLYYPHRVIPRDRWLYSHIINTRGSFLTFAKAQVLARTSGDNKKGFRVSPLDRFFHLIPCGHRIQALLGLRKKQCFLCGLRGDLDDRENFSECPTCLAVFCSECFEEIGLKCPVCESSIDFESGISEEEGSDSEDQGDAKVMAKVKSEHVTITIRSKFSSSTNLTSSSSESPKGQSPRSLESESESDSSSSPESSDRDSPFDPSTSSDKVPLLPPKSQVTSQPKVKVKPNQRSSSFIWKGQRNWPKFRTKIDPETEDPRAPITPKVPNNTSTSFSNSSSVTLMGSTTPSSTEDDTLEVRSTSESTETVTSSSPESEPHIVQLSSSSDSTDSEVTDDISDPRSGSDDSESSVTLRDLPPSPSSSPSSNKIYLDSSDYSSVESNSNSSSGSQTEGRHSTTTPTIPSSSSSTSTKSSSSQNQDQPGPLPRSNYFCPDDLDPADLTGSCHHHQVPDEIYDQYDLVISELTDLNESEGGSRSSSGGSSWTRSFKNSIEDESSSSSKDSQMSSSSSGQDEPEDEMSVDPSPCTRLQRLRSSYPPEGHDTDDDPNQVPTVQECIELLDAFYSGLPHPPTKNPYKS